MKKVILGISSLILVVLLITSIRYYQHSNSITQPQPPQLHQMHRVDQAPNEPEQPQTLQPITNDAISYTLQNEELNITFNQGADWVQVPVGMQKLFGGEYNGNGQELIEHSFILSENLTAFLYVDGIDWENEKALLLYSTDQGETWEESVIADPFIGVRFRKVDFLNDDFGYVILSGSRTMSQEFSQVYVTEDGGEHWVATSNSEVTRLIADGGFVDEKTGFLSYGTINPEAPDFYVTQDGGETWEPSIIHIPEKYEQIFVIAETPVKEGDHLAVLINQGPNGDYAGGQVKGKFVS
jgi:photosystem II stability/assembly factor-like uncharacterized protein